MMSPVRDGNGHGKRAHSVARQPGQVLGNGGAHGADDAAHRPWVAERPTTAHVPRGGIARADRHSRARPGLADGDAANRRSLRNVPGAPSTACSTILRSTRRKITVRRGRNIAAVAVAVRMLALGYYSYATAHIRALTSTGSTTASVGGRQDLRQRWGGWSAVGRVVVAESDSRQMAASQGFG